MANKELLKKEIDIKIQELIEFVNNSNITKKNELEKLIKESNKKINKLIDDEKIEKSEIIDIDEDDKEYFINYYSEHNNQNIGKREIKEALEENDNNFEKTLAELNINP